MAKIFPATLKKVIVQQSGGDVTAERLTYDLPQTHPASEDEITVSAVVDESVAVPIEEGILGVLLLSDEIHETPVDAVSIAAEVLVEASLDPNDQVSAIASVAESHAVAADEITGMVLVLDEQQPVPIEDVTGTEVRFMIEASSPDPSDEVSLISQVFEAVPDAADAVTLEAIVSESPRPATDAVTAGPLVEESLEPASDSITLEIEILSEQAPYPADAVTLAAAVAESHRTSTEDISGTQASFQINESSPDAEDSITLGGVLAESVPDSADSVPVTVSGNLWPDTANTTTGFTNPANATDKNETTAATCSAASSGLGNLTSNTTNGTLVISAPNPVLSDLNSISSAVIRVSTTAANTGSLSGQSINMALAYSTNDGGAWTTFATVSTFEGAQTRTVDVTGVIGNDWAKVNGFRLRATGSVVSGVGTVVIQGISTFSYHYGRLELTADRTY